MKSTAMKKVLVVSGHPDLASSTANKVILEQVAGHLNELTITRLDECYPDYRIDIPREQAALLAADIIVLQFPFYWYAMPALLKKWLDDVFSHGFAYGSTGKKLKDKALVLSLTIGGPEEAYQPQGYNRFSIEQLLRPLEQTAHLARMHLHTVYSHQMVYIPNVYNRPEAVAARAVDHASRLMQVIADLRHPGLPA